MRMEGWAAAQSESRRNIRQRIGTNGGKPFSVAVALSSACASCTADHDDTTSSAFDCFNTSFHTELKRFVNHTKIVKSKPAKEPGEQRWQLWYMAW